MIFLLHGSLQVWKTPTPKLCFTAAELKKVAWNEVLIVKLDGINSRIQMVFKYEIDESLSTVKLSLPVWAMQGNKCNLSGKYIISLWKSKGGVRIQRLVILSFQTKTVWDTRQKSVRCNKNKN